MAHKTERTSRAAILAQVRSVGPIKVPMHLDEEVRDFSIQGEDVWVQAGKVYKYRPELEIEEERRARQENTALKGHRAKYQKRIENVKGAKVFHPARVLNLDGSEVYFRPAKDGTPADLTPIDTINWHVSGRALLQEIDGTAERVSKRRRKIHTELKTLRRLVRSVTEKLLQQCEPSPIIHDHEKRVTDRRQVFVRPGQGHLEVPLYPRILS